MKIYVAGKTHDVRTVRMVQTLCKCHHHTITHDWTDIVEEVGGNANEHNIPPEQQRRFAYYDMMGVYNCDLIIACGHPHLTGTLIEVGMALAWNRPVWVFNWHLARQTVFQHLENFTDFGKDISKLNEALANQDPRWLELHASPRVVVPPDSNWDESSLA